MAISDPALILAFRVSIVNGVITGTKNGIRMEAINSIAKERGNQNIVRNPVNSVRNEGIGGFSASSINNI